LLNKPSLKLITANTTDQYKIVLIKINQSFVYSKYLYLFSNDIQKHINSFLHYRDKVTAFTSAMLKYYYLPALLGIKPAEIRLGVSSYGKPYLINNPSIDFNISHSGEYVGLAVGTCKKIGIDIELIDKDIDLTMKSIIFSESEWNLIDNYFDFFVLWTKMEAYLKCIGVGFADKVENLDLNTDLSQDLGNYQIETVLFKNDFILSVCISN
jgi:4'-phosphopantetheinyl transferase